MSEDNQPPPAMPPEGEGGDEPLRELMDLERDPSPGFLVRVRQKIYRRTAVSHVATFSWHLPKVILLEMIGMLGHILNAFTTQKGSRQ